MQLSSKLHSPILFFLVFSCFVVTSFSQNVTTTNATTSNTTTTDTSTTTTATTLPNPLPSFVMVYRVEYTRLGEAVNYPAPRFGWFFIDPSAGTVTSITVLVNPFTGTAYYTTSLLTGTFFKASPVLGGSAHSVIAASSGAGSGDQAFLQISGKATRRFTIANQRIKIAEKLQGYLLSSGADIVVTNNSTTSNTTQTSNSTTTTTTANATATLQGIDTELGFVGYTRVVARLEKNDTQYFNSQQLGVAGATLNYTTSLEADGISNITGSSSNSTTTSNATIITP